MVYQLAADLVLLLHGALVLFVVVMPLLVVAGNRCNWRWVNGLRLRSLHLLAIAVVAAEAWLGVVCPLTTLEQGLRVQAGQVAAAQSFIEYWLQRLLFYRAPGWVFTLVYTLFALLVAALWWRYPPRR
jgi:polyferredoxin